MQEHLFNAEKKKSTSTQNYIFRNKTKKQNLQGFPGGAVVKNLPANARDTGSSPGPGGSHVPPSN